MKLKRTTLVLLLLAVLMGGFVYFYEFQWKSQQEAVKKKQKQLFSFKEKDVQKLNIKTPSETITVERSPENSKTKWLMKSPDNSPANDGTVAYLLDLLEKEQSERVISASPSQLEEFGLKKPQATIDITLSNQKTHKLTLGKPSFDDRFVYAQNQFSSKQGEKTEVTLISKNFENAVKRSLSEWKAEAKNSQTTPSPTSTPADTKATPGIPTINPIPVNPTPKQILTSPTPKVTPTPKATLTKTPEPKPKNTPTPVPTK